MNDELQGYGAKKDAVIKLQKTLKSVFRLVDGLVNI